jgi:hypothetical protein
VHTTPLLQFAQICQETGKEQEVEVLYDEGVANHIGPEPCGGLREETDEKLVGERVGGVSRRESGLIQSADTGGRVEGNTDGGATASRHLTLRGLRALACAYTPCAGTGRSQDWPPRVQVVRMGKATADAHNGRS